MNSDFKNQLAMAADIVNETISHLVDEQHGIEPTLHEAVKYVLQGGGKRIRGAMVLWCCELVSGSVNHSARIAAAAVEMVHAYSLVHDDLPAMDDDDMRRGRATCHVAYDEPTAILTGDALLTLAFEILAKEIDKPNISVKLIGQLAESAGAAGMIAGQMADLKAETIAADRDMLEYIHTNKTAKMFSCAAICGGLAGKADMNQLRALAEYGLKLGLGFQIADDILDVSATSEQLGKTAGKDAKAGKATYPAIVGIDQARQLEKQLADQAVEALKPFGDKADMLCQLAKAMLERTK